MLNNNYGNWRYSMPFPIKFNTLLILHENTDGHIDVLEKFMEHLDLPAEIYENQIDALLGLWKVHCETYQYFYEDGEPYNGDAILRIDIETVPPCEFWGQWIHPKIVHFDVLVDENDNELYDRRLNLAKVGDCYDTHNK